jgi:hypothetical protein
MFEELLGTEARELSLRHLDRQVAPNDLARGELISENLETGRTNPPQLCGEYGLRIFLRLSAGSLRASLIVFAVPARPAGIAL